MGNTNGLKIAVTGAAGFIGRAVVDRIAGGALGPVADLRLNDVQAFTHPNATVIRGTYADEAVRQQLNGDGVDLLFHLASLPGGASERDPALGRSVNLDGTIALIDAVAGRDAKLTPPVVVYTSSIAALGMGDAPVTGATALRPGGSYGTHKAMVELYLADLTRRGLVDARCVRPSGIVARPKEAYSGFATAWMSDLFHAAVERRPITVPANGDTQFWLQSIDVVADNIVHAAAMSGEGLSAHRAWTLPATVVRAESLVAALERRTGHKLDVDYAGGPMKQPLLDASDALEVGFVSDGDTDALVDAVVTQIEQRQPAGLAAQVAIP